MAESILRQRDKGHHKIYGKGNMRTKIATCSLVALLGIQSVFGKESASQDYKHDFTLGLESFHYHYDETTKEHKKFMEDNGMMYGINVAYQLTYNDSFFVRPEARWAYGHVEYKSPTIDNGTIKHIPNLLFESRLLSGWKFQPFQNTKSLTISPYTGISYRYKSDDSSDMKSKNNLSGYKRMNKLWYVPLGMRFKYNLKNQWNVQGMAEYDFLIQGKQYSYPKNNIPSPDIHTQKHGFGLRGELLIGRQFEKVSLAVGPYINYWRIKKSNYVTHSVDEGQGKISHGWRSFEPKNATTELGLKFNVQF